VLGAGRHIPASAGKEESASLLEQASQWLDSLTQGEFITLLAVICAVVWIILGLIFEGIDK